MHTFDNFAEHYDKWFETCLGKFVADCERELILELAGPKSGEKILDVGIGTGFFASEILKYQVDIIGMDVSEKMLDIARSKGLTNVFTGIQRRQILFIQGTEGYGGQIRRNNY